MESLDQSRVTKANQKEGSASKPSNGSCGPGALMGVVGQLKFHDTALGSHIQQASLSFPACRTFPNIPRLKDQPRLLKTEHP